MHEKKEETYIVKNKDGDFMKRIFKNIVSVLLLLCLAFSIASCGEETEINNSSTPYEEPDNQISYTHANIDGRVSLNEPISAIIRTEEELREVFSKIEVEWENEPIWESYDASFFETKALVLDMMRENGMQARRELAYVCVENDVVVLHINKYRQGTAVDNAVIIYPIFLEVDKVDVENVKTSKREYHVFIS